MFHSLLISSVGKQKLCICYRLVSYENTFYFLVYIQHECANSRGFRATVGPVPPVLPWVRASRGSSVGSPWVIRGSSVGHPCRA